MPTGFLDQSPSSPRGLGIVIAGHLVVLGAVMLAAPAMIPQDRFKPIEAYNVPIPPPPPVPPEPTTEARTPRAPSEVRQPKVIVPVDRPSPNETVVRDPSDRPVPNDPPGPLVEAEPAPRATLPVLIVAAVDPRFAADFQPPYPRALERREVEGIATIRVLIGADGRVKQVVPVLADDPLFHAATAAQALSRWRFRPATRGGVAEESWKTMTVRFTLTG